jgi:hypothetical protein
MENAHGVVRGSRRQAGMTRVMLALLVWITASSVVSASLATPRELRRLADKVPAADVSRTLAVAREVLVAAESTPEFVLTERTEVWLNGKACKYEEIPGHATIVLLEVAMDKRTILKIHFRTGK